MNSTWHVCLFWTDTHLGMSERNGYRNRECRTECRSYNNRRFEEWKIWCSDRAFLVCLQSWLTSTQNIIRGHIWILLWDLSIRFHWIIFSTIPVFSSRVCVCVRVCSRRWRCSFLFCSALWVWQHMCMYDDADPIYPSFFLPIHIFFFLQFCFSLFLPLAQPNYTILHLLWFCRKENIISVVFFIFFSLSLFDMNRGHLVFMYFIIWDLSNIYDVMRWVCGITKQICSATHTHCECILQLNIFLLLDDGYADARWDGKRAMFAG